MPQTDRQTDKAWADKMVLHAKLLQKAMQNHMPTWGSQKNQAGGSLSPSCFCNICSSCCTSAKEKTGVPQQPMRGGGARGEGPAGKKEDGPGANGGRGRLNGLDKELKSSPGDRRNTVDG